MEKHTEDLYDNKPPKKQGLLYSLSLGQNNGPYLSKDIDYHNPKSQKLLIGEEVLRRDPMALQNTVSSFIPQTLKMEEPLEIYDDLQGKFINYDEKYKTKFNAAENLVSNSDFWAESVERLKKEMLGLRQVIAEYKKSLKEMNDFITERHTNNSHTIQTTMKSFYGDLKEKLYGKKNENYQQVRELQQLNREKLGLHQQIEFSKRRIQDLEKIVGVKKGKKD